MKTKRRIGWMILTLALLIGLAGGEAGAGTAASGGTVSTSFLNGTNYVFHTFTTVGSSNFTVTAAGNVDVLVVAGGGGGGGNQGGGGGGGGVTYTSSLAVATGTYTVVVGKGGNGGSGGNSTAAQQGDFSAFSNAVVSVTAQGGGGGAGYYFDATSGGSGGGGASNSSRTNGANGTTGQGYAGGNGKADVGGGGGGGAGCAGFNASASVGGTGGTGLYVAAFSSWGDTNHPGYFGGGGGAGAGSTAGTGGWGGGANGTAGNGSSTPAAAASNTGGGGGGETGGGSGAGGAGGSGIVIVRYAVTPTPQQMQITFSGYTNRTEALTNFPVLVVLSNNVGQDFTFKYFATSNGYDLRFYENLTDTGNGLDYEIESWNPNAASYVWVRVPLIPTNGTGSIYAKWGNSANSSQLPCTTNGAVWGGEYRAVLHMVQTNTLDSTSNRLVVTSYGNTNAVGAIGGAQGFNGSSAWQQLDDATDPTEYTISTFIRPDATTSRSIIFRTDSGLGNPSVSHELRLGASGAFQHYLYDGAQKAVTGSTLAAGGTRYHVTGVAKNSGSMRLYVNGVEEGTAVSGIGTIWTGGDRYAIGHENTQPMGWYQGVIDELRIETIVRSSNWIWACYATMASNTTFSSYGKAEAQGGTGYKLPMAFTNYTRAEVLTNFPVLVVFSNGLYGTFNYNTFTAPSTGGDLRFTDSSESTDLDFEIEKWDNTGASYVWVRVPLLSSNTTIYAKWGGSDTTLPACTTNGAVWTNGFDAVWHMAQTNALDSTTNRFNGTVTGGSVALATGVVDGAESFSSGYNVATSPVRTSGNTVSLWFRANAVNTGQKGIFTTGSSPTDGTPHMLLVHNNATLQSYNAGYKTIATIAAQTWYHLALVHTTTSESSYLNGAYQVNVTWGTGQNNANIYLGSGYQANFQGQLDEFRVSSVQRSTNWIWAEYANMASNAFFNGYGTVASVSPAGITLQPVANLTTNSADLVATLRGTTADLYAFWDTTARGTNFTWAYTNSPLTAFTNTQAGATITNTASGLAPGTQYFYRFYGTNAASGWSGWSAAGSFSTPGLPVVDNASGVSVGTRTNTATLNGRTSATNGATTYGLMFWGTTDGSNNAVAWANTNSIGVVTQGVAYAVSLSNLVYGQQYYYRAAASNSYGLSWATNSLGFVTYSYATWYVATNGVNAAGGGDSANPWLTITYALAQTKVIDGDLIRIAAGVYTEDSIALNKGVTIEGASRDGTIVQAAATPFTAANKRVFTKTGASAATLRNMTIRHGNFTSGDSYGSAVYIANSLLTVDNCLIVSNRSSGSGSVSYSGCIWAGWGNGGRLLLINSEIRDNSAVSGSAGVVSGDSPTVVSNCLFVGNASVSGAGGLGMGVAWGGGSLEVYDSTFVSNSTASGDAGGLGIGVNSSKVQRCTFAYNSAMNGAGGGIVFAPDSRATMWSDFQNLTIYSNRAKNAGGIYLSNYGASHALYNCTIYNNTATNAGGGIYAYYGGHPLLSTIVAGNTSPSGPDIYNAEGISSSNSLVGNNANSGLAAGSPNANGSYVGTAASPIDPRLKPLYNLGGLTPVCGLYSDSVAIDHGYNPLGLATDQRGPGYPRVLGVTNDIGAFEWAYVAPPVIQPDQASISTNMPEDGGALSLTGLGLSATDADGTSWTWSSITAPSNGTVSVGGAGTNPVFWTSFTYTPNTNFNGTNSFVVQVADNMLETDSITVTVAVAAVNDAPVCTVRPTAGGTPLMGGVLNATSGTWNDAIDTNVGGTATFAFAYEWQYSTNGGADVASLGDFDAQYTVATPVEVGHHVRVQVTCTNEGVGAPQYQVVVTNSDWVQILSANVAPVIDQGSKVTTNMTEDGGLFQLTNLVITASDADGDNLTWTNVTTPANGTVSVSGTGTNPVTWSVFTYTPATNFYGTNSFEVEASDNKGGCATVTVEVAVAALNDAPVNTVAPGFSGARLWGNTLTATNGVWNDDADTNAAYTYEHFTNNAVFTYQWWRADNGSGLNSNSLANATNQAYTLIKDDRYKWFRVAMICTDAGVGTPANQGTTAWSSWLQETSTVPSTVTFTNALGDGAWNSYSNWAPDSVPTPAMTTRIGDVNVRSPVTARIGAGENALTKDLYLGYNTGASGALDMSGGSLSGNGGLVLGNGNYSTGVITQTGGTLSSYNGVSMGYGNTSDVTWALSGSSVVTGLTGNFYMGGDNGTAVGVGSKSRLTVTGPAVWSNNFSGPVAYIAAAPNADCTLEVNGGGALYLALGNNTAIPVGSQPGSIARFNVTSGRMDLAAPQGVSLAANATSTGIVNVAGGALVIGGGLAIGAGGMGSVSVTNNGYLYAQALRLGYAAGSNASMVVADNAVVSNIVNGILRMGHAAGNVSTLEMRGGRWYTATENGGDYVAIGYTAGSTGLVTISGGDCVWVNGASSGQSIGTGVGSLGRVRITGGKLTTSSGGGWNIGASGRGEVLIQGGVYYHPTVALTLGAVSGASGLIQLQSGSFTNSGATTLGYAAGTRGTIDVSGGTWVQSGTLDVGSRVAGVTGVVTVANSVQADITGAVTVGGGTTVGDRYGSLTISNATFGGGTAVTVWTNGFVELTGTGSVLRCSTFTCRGGMVTNQVRGMSGGVDVTGATLVITNGGAMHLVFGELPAAQGDFWGLRWAGNGHAGDLRGMTNSGALSWDDAALAGNVKIYTNATHTLVGYVSPASGATFRFR